jgi:hypothetical protein
MNNNDTIEFECTMAVRVWRCVECGFITPECDASCQCQREQWDEGIAVFPVTAKSAGTDASEKTL